MEKEAGADLWDARTSPEKTVNQSSKDGSMGDLHEKRRDVQQEIAEALREERRDSEELNDEKDRSALLQSYRDSCLERGKPALPQVRATGLLFTLTSPHGGVWLWLMCNANCRCWHR